MDDLRSGSTDIGDRDLTAAPAAVMLATLLDRFFQPGTVFAQLHALRDLGRCPSAEIANDDAR